MFTREQMDRVPQLLRTISVADSQLAWRRLTAILKVQVVNEDESKWNQHDEFSLQDTELTAVILRKIHRRAAIRRNAAIRELNQMGYEHNHQLIDLPPNY